MSATNFTPISLYYSATASATPTSGNLTAGELAINTNDGKLFYKDSSGVVQVLATKATTAGTFTTVTTGTLTSPAATALTIQSAGTTAITVNTSQNVGIGTNSPYTSLNVNGTIATNTGYYIGKSAATAESFAALSTRAAVDSGGAVVVRDGYGTYNAGGIEFYTGGNPTGAERMRIDSSGNVGIGTSSPSAKLDVLGTINAKSATTATIQLYSTNAADQSNTIGSYYNSGAGFSQLNHSASFYTWGTSGTERMRIDSSGNLLVGTTTTVGSEKVGFLTSANTALRLTNTNASFADTLQFSVASRAASSAYNFLYCSANGVGQIALRGDGVIFAQNTTVQSISDVRTKENIVNATDGIKTINALRPVRFDFKEGFGNDKKNQLGFIAQEIEQVFPDAVDTWGESDDPEKPYKSVGTTALIPVLVKAMQEQQALIESLTTRLTALEK